MNRLIATAALVACCTQAFAAPKLPPKPAAPTTQAHWTYIAEDSRDNKYYINQASVSRENGMATAWLMTDSVEPEKTRRGIAHLSKTEMRHFNCESGEHSTVQRQLHAGNKMAGKVVNTATAPLDFVVVPPDTAEYSMLQHVCGNQSTIAAAK